MNTKLKTLLGMGAIAVMLPLTVAFTGGVAAIGDLQFQNRIVGRQGVTTAAVSIELGTGTLALGAGDQGIMSGVFHYNVADWDPKVRYQINGSAGKLRVSQNGGEGLFAPWDWNDVENDWDLLLNPAVAIDLDVELGAGDSTLDVGDLNLSGLTVESGAGDATVDFAGNHAGALNASIETGSGSLVVILPRDTGVRVTVDHGAGEIDAPGLTRNGDIYTNADFGTAAETLDLKIEAGAGNIELRTAE